VGVDIRMPLQPPVFFGLVRVPVVPNHVHLASGMHGHQFVHEIQKLPPAAAWIMGGFYQPGGDFQGREQRGRAVLLIAVTEAVDCLAMG